MRREQYALGATGELKGTVQHKMRNAHFGPVVPASRLESLGDILCCNVGLLSRQWK